MAKYIELKADVKIHTEGLLVDDSPGKADETEAEREGN